MLYRLLILSVSLVFVCPSKMYNGQRIFSDLHMIDFADPAKHGFHIVLDQNFVDSYLQPTKLPTVFASAIPLKRPHWKERHSNHTKTDTKPSTTTKTTTTRRVTKVLYPENGGPEDGLLDGRMIKLLGLQERSWYYICVEFESNMNRHEVATGLTCQLKRTLDKFGKTTESTISEIELLEVTDRSLTIQVVVEVDFPISLTAYLDQSSTNGATTTSKSIPANKFIVDRSRTLNIVFPFLDSDTSYGRVCILEEPVLSASDVYTAMGRAVQATMEHCYFDDLKTKPAQPETKTHQEHFHMSEEPSFGHSKSTAGQSYAQRLSVLLGLLTTYVIFFGSQ